MRITKFTYERNGQEFEAVRATARQVSEANLENECECGEEVCVEGWVWRCMAGGGGECVWYPTNEVCEPNR